MMWKKAEMGMGALVILIASLIVVAVVAGILLRNFESMGMGLRTDSEDTKEEMSIHAVAVRIIASGNGSELDQMKYLLRLPSGSSDLMMTKSLLQLKTGEQSFTLNFRNNETARCIQGAGGYYTYGDEELGELRDFDGNMWKDNTLMNNAAEDPLYADFDGDGTNDTITLCGTNGPCSPPYNGTHLRINLSGGGYAYAEMLNADGSVADFSAGQDEINISYSAFTGSDGTVYGFMSGRGNTSPSANQLIAGEGQAGTLDVYVAPTLLDDDLDGDGVTDRIAVNTTHVLVWASDSSDYDDYYSYPTPYSSPVAIPFNEPLGPGAVSLSVDSDIGEIGSLYISGDTEGFKVSEEVNFIISPELSGGQYCIEYVNEHPRNQFHVLQQHEVIELRFETSSPLVEGKEGFIRFIPEKGTPTETGFRVPEVVNKDYYVLYP